MIDDYELMAPSMLYDVVSLGLRLIPRGNQRTFEDGRKLYGLFLSLYKDVHPEITYEQFITVLRHLFPVYKNPRKHTEEFKITTYNLQKRLRKYGLTNIPLHALASRERLKIDLDL